MWQIWCLRLRPLSRVISSASLVCFNFCCYIQGFSFASWWELCFQFERARSFYQWLSCNPAAWGPMILHMQIYSVSKRAPTTSKQMQFITEKGWKNMGDESIGPSWPQKNSTMSCGVYVRTWLRSCWSRRPHKKYEFFCEPCPPLPSWKVSLSCVFESSEIWGRNGIRVLMMALKKSGWIRTWLYIFVW